MFPIRVSQNGRHFVDERGTPFLLHGDAAWSLISGLTKAEAEIYLEDRRSRGFNAIIVNLIEHKFKGPRNREREQPFLLPGDFSTPNEKYFAHADWVIRKAGEKGILVILAPCYLGAEADEGWYREVLENGVDKTAAYARYVANRYKTYDNLVWLLAGDRSPGAATPHVRAMAAAIRATDPRHLISAHLDRDVSTREVFSHDDWVGFNSSYTGPLVYKEVAQDYARSPIMPTILMESYYEGEHGATAERIRRQAYWALLSGAAGQVIGNGKVWQFDPGWKEALHSPANQSMEYFRRLFLSTRWYELKPDAQMVSGAMERSDGMDHIAGARTADGTTAIVYLPRPTEFFVELNRMKGPYCKASWFDPSSGRVNSAGTFATEHRESFMPPGGADWVLWLESSGTPPHVRETQLERQDNTRKAKFRLGRAGTGSRR